MSTGQPFTTDELIALLADAYVRGNVESVEERARIWRAFRELHEIGNNEAKVIPQRAVERAGFTWCWNGPRRTDT